MLRPDPGRIAAQIVTGIGFLGAGVIFVAGGQRIKGMTSAADIWVVAAVGILAGTGLYYTALAVTAIDLAVVVLLRPVVFWLRERNGHGEANGDGLDDPAD